MILTFFCLQGKQFFVIIPSMHQGIRRLMKPLAVPMLCSRCHLLCATSMHDRPVQSRFPRQCIVNCIPNWFKPPLIPVPDADIVCSRAKNHYDPDGSLDFSDSATQMEGSQADTSLDAFRRGFKQLHPKQALLMYFSVGSFHIRSAVCFLMSFTVISPIPRFRSLRLDIHIKKCSFIFGSCWICSCVSKTKNQLDLDRICKTYSLYSL